MIDQKRILEAEKNVQQYIQEERLFIKRKDIAHYVPFFLKNAETSLLTAKALLELSTENQKKQTFGLEETFETYLWVIVPSYYSMFYAALALFAKNEMKVGDQFAHKVVADTLIVNFLKNQKLAKLLEMYEETKDQAMQIMGSQDKARILVQDYEYERQKRHELQYEVGKEAKHNLANTSLTRATQFIAEIRNILRK